MNAYPCSLPIMPPLPQERTKISRAFEFTAIDYFGPTNYKEKEGTKKAWIVLMTCLSTRATYMEPTKDMTADSLLMVLRSFIARRGKPSKFYSDNGTQFVMMAKICQKALAHSGDLITWKFSRQLAAWENGIVERIVQMSKRHFQRTLGRLTLTFDELKTFAAEVEAVLNSRPLTIIQEDSMIPLRPVDFLIPKGKIDVDLEGDPEEIDFGRKVDPVEGMTKRWKALLSLVDWFWNRWRTEYLIVLREKSAWFHHGPRLQNKNPPKINDVVLVDDDFMPRNLWKMGRVTEHLGSKEAVRAIKMQMSNGKILTRPLSKIYPLELNNNNNEQNNQLGQIGQEKNHEASASKSIKIKDKMKTKEMTPHAMITRKKAKTLGLGTIAMLVLFVFTSLIEGKKIKKGCTGCKIEWTKNGLMVEMPNYIDKMEICCTGLPCFIHNSVENLDYHIAKDILVIDHSCETNFWKRAE